MKRQIFFEWIGGVESLLLPLNPASSLERALAEGFPREGDERVDLSVYYHCSTPLLDLFFGRRAHPLALVLAHVYLSVCIL